VVVGVDPQPGEDDLNQLLLEMAASLAKTAGSEWHIVCAWDLPDEEFLKTKLRPDELASSLHDFESLARQRLDRLVVRVRASGGPPRIHFCKGNPAAEILDYAERIQPDVIILGTVGRTTVRGLLMGNTADAVLRQANCSVLAVKPDNLLHG
jgi:nucleotide-binding universal stress UspA family protein